MKLLLGILAMLVMAGCSTADQTASGGPAGSPASLRESAPHASTRPSSTPESASDLLECDGPPSEMGGRANEFGPDGAGDTADQAFAAWVEANPFAVPRSGYASLGSTGDRTVYTYDVEGATKVVVVISPRFGELVSAPFTIEEMRTCDPSEYGAGVDLGDTRRAWVHEDTGALLIDIAGPGHCGWESARMMHVEEGGVPVKQYLRDPNGVFDQARLLDTYAEGVELPDDASDSAYRSPEGWELWFTESDTAAFVVTPEGVERWPRPSELIGCA